MLYRQLGDDYGSEHQDTADVFPLGKFPAGTDIRLWLRKRASVLRMMEAVAGLASLPQALEGKGQAGRHDSGVGNGGHGLHYAGKIISSVNRPHASVYGAGHQELDSDQFGNHESGEHNDRHTEYGKPRRGRRSERLNPRRRR